MASVRPTIEPTVFVYFVASTLSSNLATNLLLYKACGGPPEPGVACADETAAQHVISTINAWKSVLLNAVPLVVTFFAGPWSDRHGCRRRPLVFLSVTGQIVTDLLNAYCSWRWTLSPAVTAVLQASALVATGGQTMMYFGAFAFLADTTDMSARTVRFGLTVTVLAVGTTVGQLAFGLAFDRFGFVGSFGACAIAGAVALGLAAWLVPDASTAERRRHCEKVGFCREVARTLSPGIFVECVRVTLLERACYKKHILILVLIAAPLTSAIFDGENSLMYLFLRKKFHWDETRFSIYMAYTMCVIMAGTSLTLWIMSGKLKMNDSLISIIATLFDSISAVVFFLASEEWHLYLIPPIQLFRGTALSITGSITSKCVESHELGTINSVRIIVESLTKGSILPLYNIIYNKTLDTFPSAFFMISIVLTMPLIGCFSMSYYLSKKQKPSSELTRCPSNTVENYKCIDQNKLEIINIDNL